MDKKLDIAEILKTEYGLIWFLIDKGFDITDPKTLESPEVAVRVKEWLTSDISSLLSR